MGLFKDNKGNRCEKQADGSIRCRVFKAEDNEKISSGTDVLFHQDPNTCRTTTENFDILNEDDEQVEKVRKALERDCKGGI